ncbi:hypothetical protein [Microbulbifer pacificus]|uniref:hypothetical protein n=1 Tax=Microbulbifer pacificus TaxID=407164 RepID=UPI000CF397F9|nr:hypothetical protein [Microbulbifer pacificus]
MMRTQYWEPWTLDDTHRDQVIGKAFAEEVHLVTSLRLANEVTRKLERQYKPGMTLDALRALEYQVRNVALYAEEVINGCTLHCERAKTLMNTLGKHFEEAANTGPAIEKMAA